MSHHIDKNNPNRWFLVQTNGSGEESITVFGNLGVQGGCQLTTGQPVLFDYLTEQELETKVNDVAGDNEYYKNAVENDSPKFVVPSGIY